MLGSGIKLARICPIYLHLVGCGLVKRRARMRFFLCCALLVLVVVLIIRVLEGRAVVGGRPFPGLFIFGDSLVDVGNNNYILTLAKANVRPFGIDSPLGPTGRFSNGLIILDVVAELLGLPFPPPYLAPTTKGIILVNGVNYASAAGGILERSGFNFLGRVAMDTQLDWFSNNIEELQRVVGTGVAMDIINHSIYIIVIGNNDYINNYFLGISGTAQQFTLEQFQQIVLTKFRSQLMKLYRLGARNIVVSNLGALGCLPSQEAARGSINGECAAEVNDAAKLYNIGLRALLDELNVELNSSKFAYVNNFNSILDFHDNPAKYGFKFTSMACCGLGIYNGQLPCVPTMNPCPNRDDYLFFDAFHPTQKANIILANQNYESFMNFFFGA